MTMKFSRWFRLPYVGTGPILVAILLTVALIDACWSSIRGVETYPDPVASWAALNDIFKARDFIVIKWAIAMAVLLSVSIAKLCDWVASSRPEVTEALNELLLATLIPTAWRLAMACSMPDDHFPPVRFLAVFPLVALIAILAMARYRALLNPDRVTTIGGGIVICILLSIFAGLALPTSVSRLIPATVPHLMGTAQIFAGIGVGLAASALIALWIASSSIEVFEGQILRVLRWIQYPLPLLFFYVIPPQIVDSLHRFNNPYPVALALTIAAGCLTSWFLMFRRFAKPFDGFHLSRALAPASVSAVILFVWCGSATLPTPFRDYFHYGEQMLPWQQWWEFGLRPFTDVVPVHSLMPFIRGFFSQAFFDGSMASFTNSDILLNACGIIALALTMSMLVTPLGALFLLLGALAFLDRMFFLAPALFLVACPSLMQRPARHLLLWIVLSVLMVAYNPAIGTAFAVGTVPLGLWLTYRLCRVNLLALAIIALLVAVTAAMAWEIISIRTMAIQFVHFMLDNAWTNEIAHATAWDEDVGARLDETGGIFSTFFLFELARVAWVIVCVIAAGLFWQEFRREPPARRRPLLVLAGCAPLAMLLTVPWLFGRIGTGSIGRPGMFSHMAVYTILPALLMLALPRRRMIGTLLITAMAIGYFYDAKPVGFDLTTNLNKAVQARVIAPQWEMVDGKTVGLPRLGQVLKPDPDFISQIVGLKKILGEFLRPGETYLDMTNQTELYNFLDLPCPSRYADFVAANSRLQSGELEQLNERPVHTVMIGPAGWIDGLPASLRTYEIYRNYALKFAPVQRDQWIFLVDPARFPGLDPVGSNSQLALLDSVFRLPNLQRLAVSWGQSWQNMKYRFDHVADIAVDEITFHHDVQIQIDGKLKPTGTTPYWEYVIPKTVTDGATGDFVRLAFDAEPADPTAVKFAMRQLPLPGSPEPAMACYWVTQSGSYSAPIQFKARPGNLIIPLGAYPRWLLGKTPMTFRLDFQNPASVKWFKISEIEFLHLKTLPAKY